jgi:hypothetical protein
MNFAQGAAEERPRCGAGLRRGPLPSLRPVSERKVIILRERGKKRCDNVRRMEAMCLYLSGPVSNLIGTGLLGALWSL